MREYKSFEEIERDLEILRLQKEVEQEEAKLDYNLTKENMKPKNLIKDAIALGYKAAAKVLGFMADKMQR